MSKRFGDVLALRPTDVEVSRGEFFSLLGSSGSGKTTTLRIIAGFEEPTTGTVYLQDRDVTGVAPYERNVNTVFQDYALFPHMSVQENVGYGLRVRRVKKSERERRVAEALELVRLPGYGPRRPAQLSGGQRQRVALARALVNAPLVLLLDEPLGALDLKLRREMQQELKRIQRDVGITFIYVTHDQEEAMSMSDRVAVMSDGRIEQLGTPTDVYERPENAFVAGFVGVSNLLPGRVLDRSETVITVETGQAVIRAVSDNARAADSVVLAVRPEKILITLDNEIVQQGNSVDGHISDVSYAGPFTRYGVEVGDEVMAVVEQNSGAGPRLRLGQRVYLHWRIDQTITLSGSKGDVERGQRAAIPVAE